MERIQEIQKLYALMDTSIYRNFVLLLFVSLCSIGCSTYPDVSIDKKKVDLMPALTETPEEYLLDIRIPIFDPGKLPSSKNASRGLSEEVRKAEAHYMAVQLRNTLQQTGHWGAVRVVPTQSPGDEAVITGRILKSNSEELKLEIAVSDATGARWFKETFKGAVSIGEYDQSSGGQAEALQNVYNRIANKLSKYRKSMDSARVRKIRQIAELQFAEYLMPVAFADYLKKNSGNGQVSIDRLPPEDDELLARVRRARERDYMLVDTLDTHYEDLHRRMKAAYANWRRSRLIEMNMIREVDDKKNQEVLTGVAMIAGAIGIGVLSGSMESTNSNSGLDATAGSFAAAGVGKAMDAGRISEEAEINRKALEELGHSFAADVEPIILKVEGETIELTGSAEATYQQWRELLGKLYQVETEAGMTTGDSM